MVMASRDRSAKANRDLRWTTESCAQGEASGFGQERNFTFAGNLILKWLFHPKSCYLAKSSTATSTSVQRAQIWRERCNWTEGLQLIELESSTVMQSVPEE